MFGYSSFLRPTVEAGSWVDGPYNKNVSSPRALSESSRRRTGAAPTLSARAAMVKTADLEGGTGFTHVSLVGAPAGERYCFPGVGQPPDFLQRQGSCKGDPLAQNKRCHCWCETSPEGAARRCGHKPRHRHKCSKCRTLVCTGSCWIAHRQMCHLCSTHSSGD